jgi:hypothetical protein
MSIVLRIIFTALWLILANLIFFDFQPGGRYLILCEAMLISFAVHGLRLLVSPGLDQRFRILSNAGGLIAGLGMIHLIFTNTTFTIPGVLFVYGGLLFMEMVISKNIFELKVKN